MESLKKLFEKSGKDKQTLGLSLQQLYADEERKLDKQFNTDLSTFGGIAETNALADRLRKEGVVSQARLNELYTHMPPAPAFRVHDAKSYAKLWFYQKRKYNRDVAAYRADKAKWYESDEGLQLTQGIANVAEEQEAGRISTEATRRRILDELDQNRQAREAAERQNPASSEKRRIAKEEHDRLLAQYRQEGLFPDIPSDPAVWEERFRKAHDEEAGKKIREKEIEIGSLAYQSTTSGMADEATAIHAYCFGYIQDMNDYCRNGTITSEHAVRHSEALKAHLGSVRLSRDLVCRRGVKSFRVAASMFGMDGDHMTEDQVKRILKQAMKEAESRKDSVYLTDKGFISTSLPGATAMFEAGDPAHEESVGIEFIILAKKGTHAMNVCVHGDDANQFVSQLGMRENELLLNAGTKFRLVKAYFGDDTPQKGAGSIIYGTKRSWKFYLETVPGSEEGVLR